MCLCLFKQYCMESQIRLRGFDPKTSLLTLKPKEVMTRMQLQHMQAKYYTIKWNTKIFWYRYRPTTLFENNFKLMGFCPKVSPSKTCDGLCWRPLYWDAGDNVHLNLSILSSYSAWFLARISLSLSRSFSFPLTSNLISQNELKYYWAFSLLEIS